MSRLPFTVENFRDLIKLLQEHPEWRAELRRLVLSEELLTVPVRLDRLARAAESSEARLAAIESALRESAAAQAETEATLARLAERQERTEAALRELAERQAEMAAGLARLTERVDQLTASHVTLRRAFDDLKGWTLELRYERWLPSIVGHVLRRARVATPVVFVREIEDRISEEAFEELRNADLLVRARLKRDPQRSVWLVVEVSAAIDPNDVARVAASSPAPPDGRARRSGLGRCTSDRGGRSAPRRPAGGGGPRRCRHRLGASDRVLGVARGVHVAGYHRQGAEQPHPVPARCQEGVPRPRECRGGSLTLARRSRGSDAGLRVSRERFSCRECP